MRLSSMHLMMCKRSCDFIVLVRGVAEMTGRVIERNCLAVRRNHVNTS